MSRLAGICCWLWLAIALVNAVAEEPAFYRAINLNGPALIIDGHKWEGKDAASFSFKGSTFENQTVALKPPTDAARAQMIRSSVWGSSVELTLSSIPEGMFQVFLYVWEDNHSERFDVLVNDALAQEGFHSGSAGMWKKLGPWRAQSKSGKIKVSAQGGAANLSGVEVWQGEGAIMAKPAATFVTELTSEHTEFFERRIRPLLAENCYECHSAGAKKIGGGLLLDSRAGVVKGGDTGVAVTPGSPEASLLIQAVKHTDPNLTMPPKKKLSGEQIADLVAWVKMGLPDPRAEDTVASVKAKTAIDWKKAREWWSFRPLASPAVPTVTQKEWPINEIDRFILAAIEKAGLGPGRDADKRALIRRATYDLTGLPPTPEEIDSFLADASAGAFEKVVDRLLSSRHYGERWGRHWLDVVRYADTAGDNSDFPIPQMYRYRNWVISAFNRDMPYDQFVRYQLAGDLVPASSDKERHERIIATGYLANARRFGSRVVDYPQHLTIEDTIDNLGRTFLGLTVSCARCHDHKFDPIPTRDYYALYGIFHSTRYPWPGIELEQTQRDLVPLVSTEEFEAARKAQKQKQKELDAEVARLQKETKAADGEEKKKLQKDLEKAQKAANAHKRTPLPVEQAYAVAEGSKIEDTPIQQKGDPAKPGQVVRRGFVTAVKQAELPQGDKTSGRLQLANWIVDKENPLAARVMANRIWVGHFGRGIVPTPNDFGRQGKPPSHPELLDWLVSHFVESGWSVKAMHRLIMLSRTYRLESRLSDEVMAKDANNELLSAFPRRRLDAESIRDTLLALAGKLDRSEGGAHPFPMQPEWNFTQHNPFKATYDTRRRSVYVMTQRIQRHPYLGIFDGPDPAASTAVRLTSTTPLQALYLLNDAFVHEQSRAFAARLLAEASDEAARLDRAYRLALGRPPDSVEVHQARQFLAAARGKLQDKDNEIETWQAMARVLFRLNEFVYID